VRGRIGWWWKKGRYGCQNDGLDELDTMEGKREGGREGRNVPSACFSSHSPLMGFWWRRMKCTCGGREEGREGG